ncbi:MAG: rhomboid family intramembrane serine protease [Pseudomonadota bacterium]
MHNQRQFRPQISFGGPLQKGVKKIIIITIVTYIIQTIAGSINLPFIGLFSLVPDFVKSQYFVWQLLTYNFLHGGVFHILINMLVLYMFGNEIETVFGQKRFIIYYLLCGIGAGIITVIFSSNSLIPVVGASGAIYGLLMAYALLFPNRQVLFMMIFPIKVKWMVTIFIAVEFFGTIEYSRDGISHVSHLGGLLIGFLYFLFVIKRDVIKRIQRTYTSRTENKDIFLVKNDEYEVKDDDEKTFH